jgi:hypothetical protein
MRIPYGAGPTAYIAGADRGTLLAVADDTAMAPAIRAAAGAEIERRYGCADCGAPAGEGCRPEYGCTLADRGGVGYSVHAGDAPVSYLYPPQLTASDMRQLQRLYRRRADYGRASAYSLLAHLRDAHALDADYRAALASHVADIHAAAAAGATGAYWRGANYRTTLEHALRRADKGE